MVSYLGSLVQFSPGAGRAGLCRQLSLCVGSTCRVLAKQPAVLGSSPRVLRAFSFRGERLGWPEVCARSPRVRCAFSPCGGQPRRPEVWAASPRLLLAFSLHGEWLRQPEVLAASPRVLLTFSLCGERPGKPEVWRPLHRRAAPFPSAAPARAAGRVSGSLQIGTGACVPGGRGWLLWG